MPSVEYVGTLEWINGQVADRSVKGSYITTEGIISESFIGDPRPMPVVDVTVPESDGDNFNPNPL